MSLLYAASYPERTSSLILYGTYAKHTWAPDYPCGWDSTNDGTVSSKISNAIGAHYKESISKMWAPSIANDLNIAEGVASYFRTAASPGAAVAIMKMNREFYIRHVVPRDPGLRCSFCTAPETELQT